MLTVIIPTRNREENLKQLLKALGYMNNVLDKIIVIDSSDKKCNDLIVTGNAKIIYNHTLIRSAAIQRNIGMSFVDDSCKFLFFLDDDVLPNKDYFNNLISTLINNNAIGVSGIAVNSKIFKKVKKNRLSIIYRYIFLLDSKKEGVILKSGVNIPVIPGRRSHEIVKTEWLIGCALWDFQKIKNLRFDNRLHGQSLGEDVLFSLKASRIGPLFVDSRTYLEHSESAIERPNQFEFYRMWIRNRYYIVSELADKKHQPTFHWCNLGKSLSLFVFIAKDPINSINGLMGIAFGYFDLVKRKNAN
jgi:GT2 family glycosyltransferase